VIFPLIIFPPANQTPKTYFILCSLVAWFWRMLCW